MRENRTETKEYTLLEMSDIIERIASVGVTSVATDYGTGLKYNPVEVVVIGVRHQKENVAGGAGF